MTKNHSFEVYFLATKRFELKLKQHRQTVFDFHLIFLHKIKEKYGKLTVLASSSVALNVLGKSEMLV